MFPRIPLGSVLSSVTAPHECSFIKTGETFRGFLQVSGGSVSERRVQSFQTLLNKHDSDEQTSRCLRGFVGFSQNAPVERRLGFFFFPLLWQEVTCTRSYASKPNYTGVFFYADVKIQMLCLSVQMLPCATSVDVCCESSVFKAVYYKCVTVLNTHTHTLVLLCWTESVTAVFTSMVSYYCTYGRFIAA